MLADSDVAEKLYELKQTEPKVFERIKAFFEKLYKHIVGLYKNTTNSLELEYLSQAKDQLETLKNLFAEGLYQAGENAQKTKAGVEKTEDEIKYQLRDGAVQDIEKALTNKNYTEDVYLTENTPSIMRSQKGVKNLPMLMKASHIRENIFTEEEAKEKGLKTGKNINYHGLGKTLFVKIIDGLEDVSLAYRGTKKASDPSRRENYFLLISQYKDEEGKTINIPVYINETGQYNRVFIDTNKIATVFGRKSFNAYIEKEIRNGNLVRIKKRGNQTGELTSPINASYGENASTDSISDNSGNVNTKNSFRDDSYMQAVSSGDTETAQRMVDEAAADAGYTIKAYHGTARGDRVGNVFLPERATSGPMAFFTDNPSIAENYAKSKQDTSIAYDHDFDRYETQFRIKTKYQDIPLYRAWGFLDHQAQNRITKKASQLREDRDGDNDLILDPETNEANGGFQWQLKEARGNAIQALIEQWLNSGNLFNEERRFLDVLEMAGVTEEFRKRGMDSLYFKDPNEKHEKVYNVFLGINNPFETAEGATEQFADDYLDWYFDQDEDKYDVESASADLWDKNNIDAETFAERIKDDVKNGTSHAWTSIPDSMSDYLKSLGYDGIKDTGGKYTGEIHTVWIPFSSEQIKSAEAVTYDDNGDVIPLSERFNSEKADIRYSPRDYSYEALTSKPDMKITIVNDSVKYNETKTIRKNIVDEAIKKAAVIGKINENGNVLIHVDDIDTDVIVSKRSLLHGLDRRLKLSTPIVLNVGSILENSIRINELIPKSESANSSYILIGYAEGQQGNYPVRFIVNKYTNEIDSIDVLYALNTKKEAAGKKPGSHGKTALPTTSVISISDLLDYVNKYFPDVLPEDVLKHYGHESRPRGTFSEDILFSNRDYDSASEEVTKQLEKENKKLREDLKNTKELLSLQSKQTGNKVLKRSSVEAAARQLIKTNLAFGDSKEFADVRYNTYSYISNSDALTWECISEQLDKAVDWIKSHPRKSAKNLKIKLYFDFNMNCIHRFFRQKVLKKYAFTCILVQNLT